MKNIVLIGLTGCGKTTIGRKLAKAFSIDFVDMDEYIEQKEGKTVSDIFKDSGEPYFRSLETVVAKELSETGGKVIATGGGVILNPKNMEYLKQNAVTVFLDRSPDDILKKINLSVRPMLAQNKNRLYELYTERLPLYETYADLRITGGTDVLKTLKQVENGLKPLL
ncbi:MAG: shikimate kinase [Clostridia bacterium]|nr:shikimate kinase [Clostridia bacterium]